MSRCPCPDKAYPSLETFGNRTLVSSVSLQQDRNQLPVLFPASFHWLSHGAEPWSPGVHGFVAERNGLLKSGAAAMLYIDTLSPPVLPLECAPGDVAPVSAVGVPVAHQGTAEHSIKEGTFYLRFKAATT